jgi:hypothetical protein
MVSTKLRPTLLIVDKVGRILVFGDWIHGISLQILAREFPMLLAQ